MIQAGESFPSICLALKGHDLDLRDRFRSSPGLLLGATAAFHPICSTALLPGYKVVTPYLKDNGLGFVGCLAVNDPFVLRAWAKKLHVSSEIVFISDVNAALTRALGMVADDPDDAVFGTVLPRARRFAILVGEDSKVLAVGVDEAALAHNFVPRLCEILHIHLPQIVNTKILQFRHSFSRHTSLLNGGDGTKDQDDGGIEDVSDEPLLPFPIAREGAVGDTEHVHITFDYSGAGTCEAYNIKRESGRLEISPQDPEDDLGFVRVDETRVDALRTATMPTARGAIDKVYRVVRVVVTAAWTARMKSSEGLRPHLTVMVIHRREDIPDRFVVVVFNLQPNGRDVLLANLVSLPELFDPEAEGKTFQVQRTQLLDPRAGLDIAHFVWPYAKFLRFEAPCQFVPEVGSKLITWFVAAGAVFASTEQIRILRELIPPCTAAMTTADEQPPSTVLAVCEVQ